MADDDEQIPPPPPPLENPFESPRLESGYAPTLDNEEEGLSQGAPNVAARAGKTFVVLGVVGVAVLFLLYTIIFGGKKEDETKTPKQITIAPKPPEPLPLPVLEPQVPVAPPTIVPPPVIPEALKMDEINLNPITPKDDSAAKAQALARMRSNMLIKDDSSGSLAGALTGGGSAPTTASDVNSQFAAGLNTKVERVQATRIGDMRRTIAQGRIIQATMESALNTDLPAPIRAIVSRDTYGEAGNVPLIPKGSRLIGTYNTTLGNGQTRVFVVWTRVIRPDGVDVMLGSPLVDALGSAGVTGQIDTKFQQMFSRSLLSSVMNIALAIGSDKITGGETTTTTSTTGSQTSGDSATTATTNALNRLGSITDGFIQKFINVPPTILVDQGTPVNVFVNKDLVFPSDAAGAHVLN